MAASAHPQAHRIELEILKESLLHRADGARIAVLGMLISSVPFSMVLARQVPLPNLAFWVAPMLFLLGARGLIGVEAKRALSSDDEALLRRYDVRFRVTSILTQFWVGTGMWTVAGRGPEVDLYVTLAVCIFGTGAAVSLAHDARSVMISIPLLFGQCILFWLMKGADGIHISVPLIPVMLLIIAAARRSERNLNETIAIRFENDDLLRRLEKEKEAAVLAARQAEEANRSKSLFMAAASHDLRQPLYAITLLAETLALHPLADEAMAVVKQQGRSLEALRHMFDNLLDLSRFDSGDVQPRIEAVFLPDLLAELVAEFQPQCENKGLELETSLLEEYVSSDRALLERLLRNLICNAVRYTDAGRVVVRAGRRDGFVDVTIEDTGCGIAPEDQQRVFQEFVQLSNPERSREKGVGLGLSIVQRIASLLDHELRLHSEPERGTSVQVRLRRASGAGIRRAGEARVGAAVPALSAGLYVWIVEDDRLVRDALDTHLRTLSIQRDFATNRKDLEALTAQRGWPDYVLLDDMLGHEETGLDLALWLALTVPKERILLVTGNTEPERRRTLEASGFRVLCKPLSSDDLQRWLSGSF